MKTIMAAASAAALLSAQGASAAGRDDFLISTGADLAALCAAAPADADYAASVHMCQGFIVGVNQMHTAMSAAAGAPGVYCLPAAGAPTRDEAVAAFTAWMAVAPEVAALPAVESLVRWAAATYPCK
ncbi:MAG: Rap1a/Tai family immunity protein [Paracoccaceae bacterium]